MCLNPRRFTKESTLEQVTPLLQGKPAFDDLDAALRQELLTEYQSKMKSVVRLKPSAFRCRLTHLQDADDEKRERRGKHSKHRRHSDSDDSEGLLRTALCIVFTHTIQIDSDDSDADKRKSRSSRKHRHSDDDESGCSKHISVYT